MRSFGSFGSLTFLALGSFAVAGFGLDGFVEFHERFPGLFDRRVVVLEALDLGHAEVVGDQIAERQQFVIAGLGQQVFRVFLVKKLDLVGHR